MILMLRIEKRACLFVVLCAMTLGCVATDGSDPATNITGGGDGVTSTYSDAWERFDVRLAWDTEAANAADLDLWVRDPDGNLVASNGNGFGLGPTPGGMEILRQATCGCDPSLYLVTPSPCRESALVDAYQVRKGTWSFGVHYTSSCGDPTQTVEYGLSILRGGGGGAIGSADVYRHGELSAPGDYQLGTVTVD